MPRSIVNDIQASWRVVQQPKLLCGLLCCNGMLGISSLHKAISFGITQSFSNQSLNYFVPHTFLDLEDMVRHTIGSCISLTIQSRYPYQEKDLCIKGVEGFVHDRQSILISMTSFINSLCSLVFVDAIEKSITCYRARIQPQTFIKLYKKTSHL